MADLSVMLDKIKGYRDLLSTHGFVHTGDGVKPWSHRYTRSSEHVDTRNTEWTAYVGNHEVCSGPDVDTLRKFLCGGYNG